MRHSIVLTAVVVCGLAAASCTSVQPSPSNANSNTSTGTVLPVMSSGASMPSTNTNTPATSVMENNIRVLSPVANGVITSPVTLEGRARGWFFEASFPVSIVDDSGKVLFEGSIEATEDWMTTAFVPFKKSVSFQTPTTPGGKILFMKSNPSGLPEMDERYEVPVQFQR